MKFWEAMKALDEGKMVRAECFDEIQALENYHGEVGYKEGSDFRSCDIFSVFNEKWELYEEPEHTFSFAEVVKGLKDGKRFRRKGWHEDMAICCYTYQKLPGESVDDQDLVGYRDQIEEELEPIVFSVGDFEATDWVEMK